MKILITGGAGFIGSHLCRELLRLGHEVSILDNLSTSQDSAIEEFKSNPSFSYTFDNITNSSVVTSLIEEADFIYHLAAAVGVRLIIEKPIKSIETNVLGTEIILKAAASNKTPVFIASSSEVYGKTLDVPFQEDNTLAIGATSNARWSYACSKALDECIALAYFNELDLPVIVGRLFNTVGPGQTGQYGMVLPNFVKQALNDEDITVYGDGQQTRCFCHVSDTVQALIKLMQSTDGFGEVYNIGSTKEISILGLAERVRDIVASKSKIVTINYKEAYGKGFDDMQRRVPDITKIRNHIGWEPTIELEQLIKSVMDDIKISLG